MWYKNAYHLRFVLKIYRFSSYDHQRCHLIQTRNGAASTPDLAIALRWHLTQEKIWILSSSIWLFSHKMIQVDRQVNVQHSIRRIELVYCSHFYKNGTSTLWRIVVRKHAIHCTCARVSLFHALTSQKSVKQAKFNRMYHLLWWNSVHCYHK